MSETEKPAACYRDPSNGVRFQKGEHRIDCGDPECRGCRPCAERWHCTARKSCSWHVAAGELTCGRCIAAVRRDLRWVEALASLLLTQAIGDGVDSQAANLAGPAPDPRGASARAIAIRSHLRTWEEFGRITEAQHLRVLEYLSADDEHHPYAVTTRWQMMLAEDYGHDMPIRLTTSTAVAYLLRNLHRIANDDEQDFPLMGQEIRKCRQHLEAVLHNDDRPDRGAPCPDCVAAGEGAPRLVREWAPGAMVDRYDTWRCPRNREHAWSHHAYVAYVEDRKSGRIGA